MEDANLFTKFLSHKPEPLTVYAIPNSHFHGHQSVGNSE
jgi:hypothetical protein